MITKKCLKRAPWNKGLKIQTNTGRTHFKKGNTLFKGRHHTKETIRKISGENHSNWKGENVTYAALHRWVEYHKGKPRICKHCGATNKERKLHWASTNHLYKRNLTDWISLCVPCHKKYDLKNKLTHR